MNAILIAGIIQAVFLSLLLFNKKRKSTGDFVLGIWLLFIGVHLLFYYIHFNDLHLKYPHLLGIATFFPMLQGPFLYIYTLIIISKEGKFKYSYLLHALPFLIVTIYGLFDFYLLSAENKLAYYKEMQTSVGFIYSVAFLIVIYNGPVYVVLSLLKLRKHRRNIIDNFSYKEEIDLSWLRYVLIGMGVIWATVLISVVLPVSHLPDDFGDHAVAVAIVFAIFFMGYYGFRQHAIYTDISVESARNAMRQHAKNELNQSRNIKVESYKKQAERYKRSGQNHPDTDLYLEKLLSFVEDEKPYFDSKLSLSKLANSVDISSNHLSQILHEKLNKNFFDFINDYRIKEVKKNLADPKFKHFTLLSIAFDCGFNSKSSFNSIFKKSTGLTPSEYQKSVICG